METFPRVIFRNKTGGGKEKMSLGLIHKKAFLDNLFYQVGKQNYDFFLAGTFKLEDGSNGFTKWKKFSECVFPIDYDGSCADWKTQKFFEQINQRQILPFEIVLDVEEKKQIKLIIKQLEKWKWDYSIWTAGKGYHIHIKGNKDMTKELKIATIKLLGTDAQKDSDKCLIALENVPHWKSGKVKREISKEEILK